MANAGQILRAQDFPSSEELAVDTDESVSSTTYIPGPNATCGVVFTAPTSGKALILWYARGEADSTNTLLVSTRVGTGNVIGSGDSFSGSSDNWSIEITSGTNNNAGMSAHRMVTGLTAGSQYNVQTEHRVTTGTGEVFYRRCTAVPVH